MLPTIFYYVLDHEIEYACIKTFPLFLKISAYYAAADENPSIFF
jgi:hypothetical protein